MSDTNLTKKSALVFSYNLFGAVLGYITMFFALKFAGQEAWGVYGSALAIAGILGVLSTLGLDSAHIKKMTQRKNKEECMGAFILLKGILALLYLLLSYLFFFVLGEYFGFKFETPYLGKAVYISIFAIFISSLSNIFKSTYQAKLKARSSLTPLFAQVVVQDILIVLFSIWFYIRGLGEPQYIGVLFAYAFLIGNFAKLFIFILWAFRDNIRVRKPPAWLVKEYILFSIPLALMGIVGVIQSYTDRTMLQFFWNVKEVGGYFAVQKLAMAVTFIGSSVAFFLYPAQSLYYERKDKRSFYEVTLKAERYLSLVSIPIVMFGVSMAEELLNIFRASLMPYSTPLIILLIYSYLVVINRPYSSQMTSANRPHEVMKVGITQATANVILNAIFIPTSLFGIPMLGMKSTGAALATLISFLLGFLYLRFKTYSILHTRFNHRILLHIMASLLALLSVELLHLTSLNLYSWYGIGIAFLLFLSVYSLSLYLTGELGREEINLFFSILKK